MKLVEEFISFILEDFVEVGLQYFYFEKYSFLPNDILVYFNASFMVLKALELTLRMIIKMQKDWPDEEGFWGSDIYYLNRLHLFFMLLGIIFLNSYPISRAAGAMYQSARGNAIIRVSYIKKLNQNKIILKGACVRYDAVDEILIATPFKGGPNCWNGADWMVILSPFGLLVAVIFGFVLTISNDL